jgi:NAD(P)-dependent dehydrogenase (short-subunit alcohol dehydrogenase family)
MGAYAAAQFAKEATTDALRRELRPFGIHVALVRPGAVMTPIWGKVQSRAEQTRARVDPTYAADYEAFLANNEASARRSATTPEDFAKAVAHAITARRPRIRYAVGTDSWLSGVAARILPDAALDFLLTRTLGRRTR